jgi:hypothetical protein
MVAIDCNTLSIFAETNIGVVESFCPYELRDSKSKLNFKSQRQLFAHINKKLLISHVFTDWKNIGDICHFSIIFLEYRSPLVAKIVAGQCPWEGQSEISCQNSLLWLHLDGNLPFPLILCLAVFMEGGGIL